MAELKNVINCMLGMQRYPWEQGVCAQALYEAGMDELWIPMAYDAVKRNMMQEVSDLYAKSIGRPVTVGLFSVL